MHNKIEHILLAYFDQIKLDSPKAAQLGIGYMDKLVVLPPRGSSHYWEIKIEEEE